MTTTFTIDGVEKPVLLAYRKNKGTDKRLRVVLDLPRSIPHSIDFYPFYIINPSSATTATETISEISYYINYDMGFLATQVRDGKTKLGEDWKMNVASIKLLTVEELEALHGRTFTTTDLVGPQPKF